ncbi:MAG: alanine--tRNA ligase, partial [bacterium]|nr:alanine--tRNA ligase [bacterium]
IRSATFMISDGIMPTNEGRGYVLRRIIRRAARHGRMLGIDGVFLANLSATVIEGSRDGYPELEEKKDFIFHVLTQEENKFNSTIDQGLAILAQMEETLVAEGKTELSGADAFKLYDTYGFPIDLTKEILEEKGFRVEEEQFRKAMEEQKTKARAARKTTNYMGADATVYESLDPALSTEFIGYDTLDADAKITAMTTETETAAALTEGETGTIVTDVTPLYATMGGQEGDTGVIATEDGTFVVEETVKLSGGKVGHIGHMTKGMLKVGDAVRVSADEKRRTATCRNHSATHLLQKALRTVLGTHVEQAGSYNDSERLRFDFSHFAAMTKEELARVEQIVNEKITEGIPVVTEVLSVEEAKKTGAMALFGEKYGEKVRVVEMGEFSKEFCGGTHVKNTASIGSFKIVSESGVAAGVRRIEALTGAGVANYYAELEEKLNEAAGILKTTPGSLIERCTHLMSELKALQSENESLKSKAAQNALGDVMSEVQDIKGVKLLATSVDDVDMNGLRELGDKLKNQISEGVIVLASAKDGKVNLIAMATDGAQAKGAHAGNLIKGIAALVGGGGGGRPNMAQAGGKNPAGIPNAVAEAAKVLESQLS